MAQKLPTSSGQKPRETVLQMYIIRLERLKRLHLFLDLGASKMFGKASEWKNENKVIIAIFLHNFNFYLINLCSLTPDFLFLSIH